MRHSQCTLLPSTRPGTRFTDGWAGGTILMDRNFPPHQQDKTSHRSVAVRSQPGPYSQYKAPSNVLLCLDKRISVKSTSVLLPTVVYFSQQSHIASQLTSSRCVPSPLVPSHYKAYLHYYHTGQEASLGPPQTIQSSGRNLILYNS